MKNKAHVVHRSTSKTLLSLGLGCALSAGLAACGGDDAELSPGDSVWSEDVRTLTISSEGGGLAVRPPNSECAPGAAEYTFTVATLQLDSIRCEGASSNAPLLNVERSRTLTAAELEALRTSLEALKVVESDECGADKPAIDLTVVDSSGTSKYRDSFYACVQDPRPMIASAALEQLFSKLGGLATSGVETK